MRSLLYQREDWSTLCCRKKQYFGLALHLRRVRNAPLLQAEKAKAIANISSNFLTSLRVRKAEGPGSSSVLGDRTSPSSFCLHFRSRALVLCQVFNTKCSLPSKVLGGAFIGKSHPGAGTNNWPEP